MSLPHPHPPADGFVLAGGRSTRIGQDKALIPLCGKPLIQHALQILREAGMEPRIAGAQSDLSSLAPALMDEPSVSSLGPLSGICSALAACSADFAVFLPVDLPLLPSGLIAWLLHCAQITQSAFTLVSVSAFVQTFPVVIHREALPHLRATLHSDNRNCLRAFRDASRALSRPFSVLPGELLVQAGQICHPGNFPPATWFLNLNTAGDLTRAEALLAPSHFK
ncbi:MAG: molybdenum cofactor guanylyltransferase [Anaerolineales bacterium]